MLRGEKEKRAPLALLGFPVEAGHYKEKELRGPMDLEMCEPTNMTYPDVTLISQ